MNETPAAAPRAATTRRRLNPWWVLRMVGDVWLFFGLVAVGAVFIVALYEFSEHHDFPFGGFLCVHAVFMALNHVFRFETRGYDKWVSK